jgi:Ca2+-binding EF-hand superfamily protein
MTVSSFHRQEGFARSLVNAEKNSLAWRSFLKALPTRDDIINLLVALEDICQFHADENKPLEIDYNVVRQLQKLDQVRSSILKEFFGPPVFLRLASGSEGKVAVTSLLGLMTRTLTVKGLFASLAAHSVGDPTSETITAIDSLEDWLFLQSQRLFQIRKMTEQFLPLWVFTAAHTIAFFHGHSKPSKLSSSMPGSSRVSTTSLKVRIRDLVSSETMKQLQQLSKPVLEEMDSNPFSRLRAVRYYDSFTVFDANRFSQPNAFEQCCIFAGGYMNPVFMDRLLQAYGGPPIDYRRFLNFAIAWDNRKTHQSVKYFWPILDTANKGYISAKDLEELVGGILVLIQCLPTSCGPQGPRALSILCDEIRDIFRTFSTGLEPDRDPDCILTQKEAMKSPEAFASIVGIVGNTQTFIEYECREDTAHKQFVAKQMREARNAKLKACQSGRSGQLTLLQQLVDDCWFYQDSSNTNPSPLARFQTFAEFLDYHEQTYGGESMEPWLARYYQWEQQEAENLQMQLLSVFSEGESVSVIQRGDEELSVVEPSDIIEVRE